MDPFLSFARAHQTPLIALIRELVECESPSDDPAAVNRFVDLIASKVNGIARVRTFPGGKFGKHLRCEFLLPGAGAGSAQGAAVSFTTGGNTLASRSVVREFPRSRKTSGQILALGHSDTVWPTGTLSAMPFRNRKGRLWGPGVLDMKSGLAFFIFAMRALRELDRPVRRKVVLQINSDEEVGSHSS
ncbi:MAG: M20/M25/M40 family metallo-hydrolase, partial [Bryobacteraceae bacterium]